MLRCTASCFELARQISMQGFTVAVRTEVDRPSPAVPPALRYSCAACGTRYEMTATRPQTVATIAGVQAQFAGAL